MTAKEEFVENFKKVLTESDIYKRDHIKDFKKEGLEILSVLATARKNT